MKDTAKTRMIPEGFDALSTAPHHDIYSIEDLRQLIYAIRETTLYEKPVCLKVYAVHNIAPIVAGIARLGADAVYIGTAVLVALGCGLCQRYYASKCSYGITTNCPDLAERLDIDLATEALVNLIQSWSDEIKELMGGMGINTISSMVGNRERLKGIHLTSSELEALGVRQAGL